MTLTWGLGSLSKVATKEVTKLKCDADCRLFKAGKVDKIDAMCYDVCKEIKP